MEKKDKSDKSGYCESQLEIIVWMQHEAVFLHTLYLNSKPCVMAYPAREMKYFNCQKLAVSNTPAAVFQDQTL